jgi:hypothetical protein
MPALRGFKEDQGGKKCQHTLESLTRDPTY